MSKYKAWIIVTPYRIEKRVLSSEELHGWHQEKKNYLYGWAGISATGVGVWLMHTADARGAPEGREEAQTTGRGKKTLNFSCRALKHELFYQIIFQLNLYLLTWLFDGHLSDPPDCKPFCLFWSLLYPNSIAVPELYLCWEGRNFLYPSRFFWLV